MNPAHLGFATFIVLSTIYEVILMACRRHERS
jgi:hypothetical protein